MAAKRYDLMVVCATPCRGKSKPVAPGQDSFFVEAYHSDIWNVFLLTKGRETGRRIQTYLVKKSLIWRDPGSTLSATDGGWEVGS